MPWNNVFSIGDVLIGVGIVVARRHVADAITPRTGRPA
jgi:hypothetical protein